MKQFLTRNMLVIALSVGWVAWGMTYLIQRDTIKTMSQTIDILEQRLYADGSVTITDFSADVRVYDKDGNEVGRSTTGTATWYDEAGDVLTSTSWTMGPDGRTDELTTAPHGGLTMDKGKAYLSSH